MLNNSVSNSDIILYPTETVYGLGVDARDERALSRLYELKGRETTKEVSWLVRNLEDLEHYALLNETARVIAEQFLPGPLTLVLPLRNADRNVGFRISNDPYAQRLAEEVRIPITCTSANISGMETCITPAEILTQFGEKANMITRVIDDGPRTGSPSTVVRVVGGTPEILREGSISKSAIIAAISPYL